jgi:predicted hotdog family 3-hydroxylacyl-ACP dehydratase
MQLDHAWIAAHIPHQGRMCLLDRVERWDHEHIVCHAHNHRDADHPLRAHGRLGAACAIEYAAQAMAVHGALLAVRGAPARAGMLTGMRQASLYVTRLDLLEDELVCQAWRMGGDTGMILYRFEVAAGAQAVASGRATVLLDASAAFAPALQAAPTPDMRAPS